MKFKSLSKNNDAVETVIAVILMVAITVILAAAIGATVFSQGPEKPGSQTKLEITPLNAGNNTNNPAAIRVQHFGGDSINFANSNKAKMMVAVNGGTAYNVKASDLGEFSTGSATNLPLIYENSTAVDVRTGQIVNIKVIDVQSNQLIYDNDLEF